MTALGIGPQARGEYLKDIFGDHKQNMAGLIDASSAEDFDTKLHSLTSVWEEREKEARGTSQPEFACYFTTYLAEEMKEKMILHLRREAGLGDKFFYDNAVESINRKFKTKIREQKNATNVSGFKLLNCTWLEAVNVYANMLEETRRNICRVLINMGPYRLAQDYQHLKIEPSVWSTELNNTQKLKALRKLDSLEMNKDLLAIAHTGIEKLSSTPKPDSEALGFENSGLPEMMKASWENAQLILKKNGIAEGPGKANTRAVISNSAAGKFHCVLINRENIPVRCDCERAKQCSLCAHMLAVAMQEQCIRNLVTDWKPNITKILTANLLSKVGKKPNEKKRARRRDNIPCDTNCMRSRVMPSMPTFPRSEMLTVVFVRNTRMQKCYGCGEHVRHNITDIPPASWDIVLTRKEFRVFTPHGSTSVRISKEKENVYYHPLRASLEKKNISINNTDIVISEDMKSSLNHFHTSKLSQEFGMRF